MKAIAPLRIVEWAPRAEIAPLFCRDESNGATRYRVTSNGSEGCYGGWDVVYPAPGPHANQHISFQVKARWQDLERGYDCIKVQIAWMDGAGHWVRDWEPAFPTQVTADHVLFRGQTRISPKGGTHLVCRLLLSWTRTGSVDWWEPELTMVSTPTPRLVRLGATGIPHPVEHNTLESNARFYLDLCRQAAEANLDILCLPEIMLQVGMPAMPADVARLAVTVPGKEIEPFQKLAQAAKMGLCFSVWERNRELVHNTAVLIDKQGDLIGKYRKVHLALPTEPWQGITPGHDFPVFELDDATIGLNICMDSSASESMRVPARKGAEILLMPIMGDHRATSQWDGSADVFDMHRWSMIHCVHAMDNQLYIVTSVNKGTGSGVFAPDGTVQVCSDGTQPVVWADVDLNAHPRPWSGCTARGMLWAERREPAYGVLVDVADPFAVPNALSA